MKYILLATSLQSGVIDSGSRSVRHGAREISHGFRRVFRRNQLNDCMNSTPSNINSIISCHEIIRSTL